MALLMIKVAMLSVVCALLHTANAQVRMYML